MNDYQVLPVGGDFYYTPDFSADVPQGISVTGIVFSADPTLTLAGQSNDYANAKASIRASGAAHGQRYILKAVATLSNDEDIPKSIALLGWNG